MKNLPRMGRTRTMAFMAALFLTGGGSAFAQSYQSYGECQSDLERANSEAERWDTAFMDCASNVRNGSVQNCKGMDSYQADRIKQQLVQRRDTQISRAKFLAPICQQMRSRERQAQIDSARQSQQQAEDERQRQRQIQLTQDQFARAQQAEERKQQEMLQSRRNYEQQRTAIATANAAAAAARNQAKAQAIGSLAGALLGMLGSGSDDAEDRDIPPAYVATERIVEKGRDKVQSTQNGLVNQIQNKAWDAIKATNRDTIRDANQLGDTISSFGTGPSKPLESRDRIPSIAGVSNPWGGGHDSKPLASSESNDASGSASDDKNPWAAQDRVGAASRQNDTRVAYAAVSLSPEAATTDRQGSEANPWADAPFRERSSAPSAQPGKAAAEQRLYRDPSTGVLAAFDPSAARNASVGDRSPTQCSKDGLGIVLKACEDKRLAAKKLLSKQ